MAQGGTTVGLRWIITQLSNPEVRLVARSEEKGQVTTRRAIAVEGGSAEINSSTAQRRFDRDQRLNSLETARSEAAPARSAQGGSKAGDLKVSRGRLTTLAAAKGRL